MNYTENYALPQWEKSDRIMMDDFNAAMEAIDTGLKAVETAIPKIKVGTYTGNGNYGESNKTSLSFDFKPTLVLVFEPSGSSYQILPLPPVNGTVCPVKVNMGIQVSWSGNQVSWYSNNDQYHQFNQSGVTYYYVAFGQ